MFCTAHLFSIKYLLRSNVFIFFFKIFIFFKAVPIVKFVTQSELENESVTHKKVAENIAVLSKVSVFFKIFILIFERRVVATADRFSFTFFFYLFLFFRKCFR